MLIQRNNVAGSKENVQDENDVPQKPSRKAHYIVLVCNNYHHYNELWRKFGQTTTDRGKNMKNVLKGNQMNALKQSKSFVY